MHKMKKGLEAANRKRTAHRTTGDETQQWTLHGN
jgi:hypothetical protein